MTLPTYHGMSPLTPNKQNLSISEGKEQRGGINTNPEASLSRPPPPQPYGTSDGMQAKMTDHELLKKLSEKMIKAMDNSEGEDHDQGALWEIWLDLKKWSGNAK
jgi:hypothetical protein